MNNIIRAERATVKFCEGVEVDGYLLPDGELRVGKVGAAIAVGYGKDWVGQLKGKPLKALQDKGFTGSEKPVQLNSINGGGTEAKTLSLLDFRKLIVFAAKKERPEAEALLDAIVDVSLEDYFRIAFGQQTLTLEEKRDKFFKAYSATIDWLTEDRSDWELIAEQELFLLSLN